MESGNSSMDYSGKYLNCKEKLIYYIKLYSFYTKITLG